MKRTVLVTLAAAALLIAGYAILRERATKPADDPSSSLRAEPNAIVITDQKPGEAVRASLVVLEKPGFLVIHSDAAGAPGTILGESELLRNGEHRNIEVLLTRAAQEGEVLHAILHNDNGNGSFDPSTDSEVVSAAGGAIHARFEINSDATPGDIAL